MGKLTTLRIAAAIRSGAKAKLADGEGLTLSVGGKRAAWTLRTRVDGKPREIGLGAYPAVTLAAARDKARQAREVVAKGDDPGAARRAVVAERREAAARTFEAVARKLHAELEPGYRNKKHAAQWIATLEVHTFPAFGDKPVAAISGPMVLAALDPIWTRTPETARRVRQRIGAVLDYAHVRGWREAAPNVKLLAKRGLPAQPDLKRHHPAVEYADAPAVVARISEAPQTMGRLALLFTILTAARSGETRGATWAEIDRDAATWTVPALRMKAKREHVVPLSAAALDVLDRVRTYGQPAQAMALVFPGAKGALMSDMTMGKAQRLAAPGSTVHGWRSTFRDWAGETTAFPADVLEACLAHAVGNRVQRAYQRGTMLAKRREVMEQWAAYVTGVGQEER